MNKNEMEISACDEDCAWQCISKVFTNLQTWFHLWVYFEQRIQRLKGKCHTNRAEHVFTIQLWKNQLQNKHGMWHWMRTLCFLDCLSSRHFECVHQNICRTSVGDLRYVSTDAGVKTVNVTFSKRSNSWRMTLRPGPFTVASLYRSVCPCSNTGIGIKCLPDAYSSARALLKTRCARLKTDSWSNNF